LLRGIHMSRGDNADICHLCYSAKESINHLFVECEKMKEYYNQIVCDKINIQISKNIILNNEVGKLENIQIISCFKYAIWILRCNKKHNEENIPLKSLFTSCMNRFSMVSID
jgi:hypothetical protein